jgi:D-alanine-D-alanine ligase
MVRSPEKILRAVDVVFIALHGTYGEDGEVQKILQRLSIPFTGSRSFPSAIAFNKTLTKKSLAKYDILTPAYREVSRDEKDQVVTIADSIKDTFGSEYIIKPVASGSSFGIELVRQGQSLETALEQALSRYERVIVEEFIRGKEATCATLENFRNERMYVFPAVEIVPPRDTQFFSTDSKYSGETIEICPARFSYSERSKIAEVSALVHEVLDLSQYSRSDFIVSDNGIYFLEVNTLPGLTAESLYPKAAAAVGLNIKQLVEHLVETATC